MGSALARAVDADIVVVVRWVKCERVSVLERVSQDFVRRSFDAEQMRVPFREMLARPPDAALACVHLVVRLHSKGQTDRPRLDGIINARRGGRVAAFR